LFEVEVEPNGVVPASQGTDAVIGVGEPPLPFGVAGESVLILSVIE
jgi:hypothetical protein